jgi:hypothetical protein
LAEAAGLVDDVLRSPGQPLDAMTRFFFDSRFGHDFSRVRVHTNAKATESARAVKALAYAVDNQVVFRADKFAPGTTAGRRLLAHELAHVMQQSANGRGSDAESRADSAAQRIMDGQPVTSGAIGTAPIGLYKQHEDQEPKEGSIASDDELIKLIRGHFGSSQRKSMFPAIPVTSPLHPNWKPAPSFDMRNREKPTPPMNLSWLSQTVPGGPSFGENKLPAGSSYNPKNPNIEKELYKEKYLFKAIPGKNPTEESMVRDQVTEGLTKLLLGPLKKRGLQAGKKAGKKALRQIKKSVPWFWLRRLIPGEEIKDAYFTEKDAQSGEKKSSFFKRLRECLSAKKKEETDLE